MQKENPAEQTRNRIVSCGAEEILISGFQSSSIASILKKAEVSKGCFYHHFPTKQDLGYAVLDELLSRIRDEIWEPILTSENTLQELIHLYSQANKNFDCERIKHGCPINNLAQEMSPIDEGFRERIEHIYTAWKQRLTEELERCQENGHMDKNANASEIATLIIAVTQGATGIAKNAQNPDSFVEYTKGLSNYLSSLQN